MTRIPFNRPYLTGKEKEYVNDALESLHHCGNHAYGQRCMEILKNNGFDTTFLTPSCTSAMEMGAILCDLKRGDEVILPSYTFSSTANAIILRGAKPVFCEVNADTMNIDIYKIEALITKKTRMILPIDYAGIPCDIDQIMDLSQQYKLWVMQDAAQSFGSRHSGNRPCGSVPHLAAFSFHETKNISCGEGGALAINEPSLVERASFIQEKGTDRSLVLQGVKSKYSWVDIGSSFLLADLLSAILLSQLENSSTIINKRKAVIDAYYDLFTPYQDNEYLSLPKIPKDIQHNNHAFFVIFDNNENRGIFLNKLMEKQVYPYIGYMPLHSSPYGMQLGYKPGDLPLTEDLASRIVRMPVYTNLEDNGLNYCIACVSEVLSSIYNK